MGNNSNQGGGSNQGNSNVTGNASANPQAGDPQAKANVGDGKNVTGNATTNPTAADPTAQLPNAGRVDPEGFRWVKGANGKEMLELIPLKPEASEAPPEAFNVTNPGPNPRTYWTGPGGLVLPGQTVEVPAEHRLFILKQLAQGIHAGGVHAQTGERYPASMERSDAPAISTQAYLDAEEKRLAKLAEVG